MEAEFLAHLAAESGLDLVGTVPVQLTPTWDAYARWVAAGQAGDMAYLTRPDAVRKRKDPRMIMPNARTVLAIGASYAGPMVPSVPALHGRVARFAWRGDYHVWVLSRLKELVRSIAATLSHSVASTCYVDTGPVLERSWAHAAGLGWVGKNGCLIHPNLGSFVFLGIALLDVDLPEVPRRQMPACGSCTACLDACPTGALVAPGVLDARRCISYLTIEHRGVIPESLREAIGDRIFGCDTCQDVCPWNRRSIKEHSSDAVPKLPTLFLPELLTIDDEAFAQRFRRSPIWRATPEGLARNAAVVLGNTGGPAGRSYLRAAATGHPSGLVRDHAAYAVGQPQRDAR